MYSISVDDCVQDKTSDLWWCLSKPYCWRGYGSGIEVWVNRPRMESGKTSAMWSGGGRKVWAMGLEVTHQYCWLGCEGMRAHPLC